MTSLERLPSPLSASYCSTREGLQKTSALQQGHMLRDLHSCYIRLFDYNLILIVPLSVSKSDSFLV